MGGVRSPRWVRRDGDPLPRLHREVMVNGPGRRIHPEGGDFPPPLAGPERCAVLEAWPWA